MVVSVYNDYIYSLTSCSVVDSGDRVVVESSWDKIFFLFLTVVETTTTTIHQQLSQAEIYIAFGIQG